MKIKNIIKTVFGIILTFIASIHIFCGFIMLITPFNTISGKIASFFVLFIIGITSLIFGIKLLHLNRKNNDVKKLADF